MAKERCKTCFNFMEFCRCPLPEGVCPVHQLPEGRSAERFRGYACLCTGEHLFQCNCCRRYNVKMKSPGFGYLCDECLDHDPEEIRPVHPTTELEQTFAEVLREKLDEL